MLRLIDIYQQQRMAITQAVPIRIKEVKTFLKSLLTCQALSAYQKIDLLTLPFLHYQHFGHALVNTRRKALMHRYFDALQQLVTNENTAMAVNTGICQPLSCEGTLGHIIASRFNSYTVSRYQQLLQHLLATGLPTFALLYLLQRQSSNGLTFGHCLAYYQPSHVLLAHFYLSGRLLDDLPPPMLFSLLTLSTNQGHPLDHYIAIYQSAAGLRHYWLFLDCLIEQGLAKTLVLQTLQRNSHCEQSIIPCVARYQSPRGLEQTVHFLDRCVRRQFDANSIAQLLTLNTIGEESFGQLLARYNNARQRRHYEQLLRHLHALRASPPLVTLLRDSYTENISPLNLACLEAYQQHHMAPLLALLEFKDPPNSLLKACLPFKATLYAYIIALPNNDNKLNLIKHCLQVEKRFGLGILFHRYQTLYERQQNLCYLQSLQTVAQALAPLLNNPPITHSHASSTFCAPKPHSPKNVTLLKRMLRTYQEETVTCYT